MLTYLRYALATICFAASVACLALWFLTGLRGGYFDAAVRLSSVGSVSIQAHTEIASLTGRLPTAEFTVQNHWAYNSTTDGLSMLLFGQQRYNAGLFSRGRQTVYFPLWYPALIFALAGVGVLRVRRKFSIRSALICLTVVAALLGMAVTL
ncbi:MAG: hypothetical protein JNL18_17880 [Planctomycetaceae bacterium]|nr:hypothetical protein [Planctomycetaceae bacterium]